MTCKPGKGGKMKTRRAAAKRFKQTGSGKYKFSRVGVRHLNVGSPRNQLRNLRGTGVVHEADAQNFGRILPYGCTM